MAAGPERAWWWLDIVGVDFKTRSRISSNPRNPVLLKFKNELVPPSVPPMYFEFSLRNLHRGCELHNGGDLLLYTPGNQHEV